MLLLMADPDRNWLCIHPAVVAVVVVAQEWLVSCFECW
jgi:hypothetical protein